MDPHAADSAASASSTDSPSPTRTTTTTTGHGGTSARRLSYHAAKPLAPSAEPATYTLLLFGSLQHFAAGAAAARVKEIPLQLDSGVRQVSCGADWVCVLTEAGRVYSFGSNTYGQLAQGHTHAVAHPKPVLFPVDKRIVRVSCGACHGGFLLDNGALFMFGCGTYGRLGTGNETAQSSPVAVKMRWRELQIAAAELAREPRTTIPGFVRSASVASPSTEDPSEQEDDEVAFVDISCGDRHTLLLGAKPVTATGGSATTTGHHKRPAKNHIIACGDGMNGRLGLGSERDYHVGMLLTQFRSGVAAYTPTFTSVHAGASHNAAVSSAGELFTWGNGADGQLGHDALESEWVPREVAFFRGNSVASAACGAKHTTTVSRAGVVYAWGRGLEGQLGTGAALTHASQPRRVTLVVDPVATQQAQIEAQLAASSTSSSFSSSGPSASSTGAVLFMPDTRVIVRTVVAHDNTAMALDEQSRLFVWGDNSAGQLGLQETEADPTLDDSENHEELSLRVAHVPTPRQLRYMDLREPKKLASRVRDRVLGASVGSLPRVALTHIAASDRFSALLFRTKQPANALGALDGEPSADASRLLQGASSRSVGSVTRRLMRQRSTLVYGLDDKTRWQFSLTEPLQLADVPSREAAFYRYMAQYKVSIRPPPSPAAEPESDDDDWDHSGQHHHHAGRRPTHARGGFAHAGGPEGEAGGGHLNVRRSSVAAMSPELRRQLQEQFRCEDPDDDDEALIRGTRSASETVKGFDAWLTRQLSPSKPHGFGTAPRFKAKTPPPTAGRAYSNQKEDLVSAAVPTRPQSSTIKGRSRPPAKSAFGRSVVPSSSRASISMGPGKPLPRRPTTAAPGGSSWRSPSVVGATTELDASTSSPPPSKDTRQRLFNQFVAPFGSSVGSRFGVALPRANDSLQLDIHPEQCAAAVLPRSPGAVLGSNADQFSQVIARRLHEAKGALPGPGTYDRHGG